jgi:hypothetical protein
MQAARDLWPAPVNHGFCNTSHEIWTGFLNILQSHWLSLLRHMLFLKGLELSGWCLWSIPIRKELRNRPHSLKCDSQFPIFIPTIQVLFYGSYSPTGLLILLYKASQGLIENTISFIVAVETCLSCCCLAMAASSCSSILAFSHHVTIWMLRIHCYHDHSAFSMGEVVEISFCSNPCTL